MNPDAAGLAHNKRRFIRGRLGDHRGLGVPVDVAPRKRAKNRVPPSLSHAGPLHLETASPILGYSRHPRRTAVCSDEGGPGVDQSWM